MRTRTNKEPWNNLKNDILFNAWVSYYYRYNLYIRNSFEDLDPVTGEPKNKSKVVIDRLKSARHTYRKKYIYPLDFDYTLRLRSKVKRKVSKYSFDKLELIYKVMHSKAFVHPNRR